MFIFSCPNLCGSTVQSILVEACSRIVGNCGAMDCLKYCNNLPGSPTGSCRYFNLCTCFYNTPPPKTRGIRTCSVGFGLCENCDLNCCNENCVNYYAHEYKNIKGKCLHILDPDPTYCICLYDPKWIAPNPYLWNNKYKKSVWLTTWIKLRHNVVL